MGLNKQKGNMYPWVTHTWNVIKGNCSHNCDYCYMKRFPLNKRRFDEKELNTMLGSNNTIFIGSSNDMWCWSVPDDWIKKILMRCNMFNDNQYIFQTKNPERFKKFYGEYPKKVLYGTTIESNRHKLVNQYSEAPPTFERYVSLCDVSEDSWGDVFVSIEPIMDFDVGEFVDWIVDIDPKFVSIGADNQGHNLPEPSKEKVLQFINEIPDDIEVKIKDNLKRIIN
jgi:DNA repair photolyase